MMTKTPQPGSAVADVLRAAYYYAMVDGRPVVDGALMLVAAARNNERQARPVLGADVAEARTALPPCEPAGPASRAEVAGCPQGDALREARWWVLRDSTPDERALPGAITALDGGPAWGADACRALGRATDAAEAAGAAMLDVPHLLVGLLAEPEPAVRRLAVSVGLDLDAARSAAQSLPATPAEPFTPLVDLLTGLGAVEAPVPWVARWVPRFMARITGRVPTLGGPVLAGLEQEVLRQAVRSGHDTVRTSAVLLAALSLEEQLAAAGRTLRAVYLPHNRAGRVLAELGLHTAVARPAAEAAEAEPVTVADEAAGKRFWAGGKPADPSWSTAALQVWDAAGRVARDRGHRDIGTSHLLVALLDGPAPAARGLLERLDLPPDRVAAALDRVADTN